jgi:hypothetical protein
MITVRNDPKTGDPEDVMATSPAYCHVERLTDKHIWIRVQSGDGTAAVFNLTSKSRITFTKE